MKRYFITILFVSLFITANSVWAKNDNKKEPAKVENAEKKTSNVKETKTSCCAAKESCATDAKSTTTCCSATKSTTKAATDCCKNTSVTNETKKSSGKKSN